MTNLDQVLFIENVSKALSLMNLLKLVVDAIEPAGLFYISYVSLGCLRMCCYTGYSVDIYVFVLVLCMFCESLAPGCWELVVEV